MERNFFNVYRNATDLLLSVARLVKEKVITKNAQVLFPQTRNFVFFRRLRKAPTETMNSS